MREGWVGIGSMQEGKQVGDEQGEGGVGGDWKYAGRESGKGLA